MFYIPFESSVKCNPMVLFGFSYYDTGYLKKVKTEGKIGFFKASHPYNSATWSKIKKTKKKQILLLSGCMQNVSSRLYLSWHFHRVPFSRIFGEKSFLH